MSSGTRQLVQKGGGPGGADIYVDPASIQAVVNDPTRQKLLAALQKQSARYRHSTQLVEGMFGRLTFLQENRDVQNHYRQLQKAVADYSETHHVNHAVVVDVLGIIGAYYEQVDGI